jgi:hypothetical protein
MDQRSWRRIALTACTLLIALATLHCTLTKPDDDGEPVTFEEAAELILSEIVKPDDLDHEVIVLAWPELLQPGSEIGPYNKEGYSQQDPTQIEEDSWFFWIDDAPGARFMHSTRFVLVAQGTGEVTVTAERWWPVLDGQGLWIERDDYWDESNWVFSNIEGRPSDQSTRTRSAGLAFLSAVPQLQAPGTGSALVINFWEEGETGREDFEVDGDSMHDALTDAGFDVTYLGPSKDDDEPHPDGEPTFDNRHAWFTEKAKQMGYCETLVLYVTGHGGVLDDGYGAIGAVYEDHLKKYLEDFDPGVHIVIVLDGCECGSFGDSMSEVADITVMATDGQSPSYFDLDPPNDPNAEDKGSEFSSGLVEDLNEILADPAKQAEARQRAERQGTTYWEEVFALSYVTALEKDAAYKNGKSFPQIVRGMPQDTRPPTPTPTPVPVAGPLDEVWDHAGFKTEAINRINETIQIDPYGDLFHYKPDVTVLNPISATDIVWYTGAEFEFSQTVADYLFGPGGPFGCDDANTICSDWPPDEPAPWHSALMFGVGFDGQVPLVEMGDYVYFYGVHFNVGGEVYEAAPEYANSLLNNTNVWYQLILDPESGGYFIDASEWVGEDHTSFATDYRVSVWGDKMVIWIPRLEVPEEDLTYFTIAMGTDLAGDPDTYSSDVGGADPYSALAELPPEAMYVTQTVGLDLEGPWVAPSVVTGTYTVSTLVVTDTGGHDGDPCYICMPDELAVDVWPMPEPGTYVVDGPHPWLAVTGTVDFEGGYIGTGQGTVAGYPNIEVLADWMFFLDEAGQAAFQGDLVVGAGGGLPGGYATYYWLEGHQVAEEPEQVAPADVPAGIVTLTHGLNAGFYSGDIEYPLASLHGDVINLYSGPQCRVHLTTLAENQVQFEVLWASKVGLWEWEREDQSTVIPETWVADVNVAMQGQATTTVEAHFALDDGKMTWMTDCGVTFEFEPGTVLDDDYTVCEASCRKREKIVEGQKVDVWCMNDSACANLGCECHLFSRDRDDTADDPDSWEHVTGPMDKIQKDNDLSYRCFCVE